MLRAENIYGLIINASGTGEDLEPLGDLKYEYENLSLNKDKEVWKDYMITISAKFNTIHDIEQNLEALKNKAKELEDEGYFNITYNFSYGNSINLYYSGIMSFGEFIDKRRAERQRLMGANTMWNGVKNFIKEELGVPQQHGGVRAIYIKLFLEGKITEEDFRNLIMSKDSDIYGSIINMVPEGNDLKGKDNEGSDYSFISN